MLNVIFRNECVVQLSFDKEKNITTWTIVSI